MKVIIGPSAFELSEPFEVGHCLSAAEAQAMNALRAQNIRRAVWNSASKGSEESLEGLVARYDREYQFTIRKTRDGRFSRLEIECRIVAEAQADVEFSREGRAVEGAEFEDRVSELLDDPRVKEEAQRRLDIKSKVAESTLEDLLA